MLYEEKRIEGFELLEVETVLRLNQTQVSYYTNLFGFLCMLNSKFPS
jgi:hypothetical protein